MSNEEEIDRIFSSMNQKLDYVLSEDKRKSEKILHTLKMELKLSVNAMVRSKPDSWKVIKSSYIDVLKMIAEIESEV